MLLDCRKATILHSTPEIHSYFTCTFRNLSFTTMELEAAAQLSTLSLPQLVRIQNKLLENYLSKNSSGISNLLSSDPFSSCEIMITELVYSFESVEGFKVMFAEQLLYKNNLA